MDAAWALQLGLYEALGNDPEVRQYLGDPARIYDSVPDDAAFPLLTIGSSRMTAYPGTEGGFEHMVRLTVYSRWGGRRECKLVAAAIRGVMQNARLPLAGHAVVQSRLAFEDHLKVREPDVYQGVMRYRVVTLPAQGVAA